MSPRLMRWGMNVWPPFLGAGIHVQRIAPDWSAALVELRARFYNRNYVGTHFRGSLFAMTGAVGVHRSEAAGGDKVLPQFEADIRDRAGEVVARVRKTLYVRLKPRFRASTAAPGLR